MAQEAPTPVVRIHDFLEGRSRDTREAVVSGETLVDERVVGGQQLEHAAVLANEMREQQLGLSQHSLGQRVVEVGVRQRVRVELFQILEPEPLCSEAGGQGLLRTGVGQHPARLTLHLTGIRELATTCQVDEILIRWGSPDEERKPGRQVYVADPVDLTRNRSGRRLLHPEQEVWAGEDRLECHADAALEAAVDGGFVVEAHEPPEVALVEGSPVGKGAQTGDDALGAWPGFVR